MYRSYLKRYVSWWKRVQMSLQYTFFNIAMLDLYEKVIIVVNFSKYQFKIQNVESITISFSLPPMMRKMGKDKKNTKKKTNFNLVSSETRNLNKIFIQYIHFACILNKKAVCWHLSLILLKTCFFIQKTSLATNMWPLVVF